jgi:hypothetical protein
VKAVSATRTKQTSRTGQIPSGYKYLQINVLSSVAITEAAIKDLVHINLWGTKNAFLTMDETEGVWRIDDGLSHGAV